MLSNHTRTPIHIKSAATLAALECVFPHRIINWHGQQLAAVWTLDFRGARDGSREAEFVGEEGIDKGRCSSPAPYRQLSTVPAAIGPKINFSILR